MQTAIRFCFFIAFIFFLLSLHAPARYSLTGAGNDTELTGEPLPRAAQDGDWVEAPMGPR